MEDVIVATAYSCDYRWTDVTLMIIRDAVSRCGLELNSQRDYSCVTEVHRSSISYQVTLADVAG